ncbi:MAG: hypothetical protein H6741_08215 [Alphaproteobacteria bacterium]|nr:hypothetical protein [Alphaproteobacteria bacterium]
MGRRRSQIKQLIRAARWPEALERRAALLEQGEGRELAELEYALALGAPLEVAALLLDSTRSGTLGPLHEILAQRFTWDELRDAAPEGEGRDLAAHARVLLEGTLTQPPSPARLGVPFVQMPWEADLQRAFRSYSPSSSGGSGIASGFAGGAPRELGPPGALEPCPQLQGLLAHWGMVQAGTLRGRAEQVAAALITPPAHVRDITATQAMRHLYLAAGGDGAYSRWRGLAVGRVRVWRALTELLSKPEVVDAEALDAFLRRCRWLGWTQRDDEIWYLHLAFEDPETGRAWGLSGGSWD